MAISFNGLPSPPVDTAHPIMLIMIFLKLTPLLWHRLCHLSYNSEWVQNYVIYSNSQKRVLYFFI